jgi:type I restriction-modification system DNA methylase subunit
MGGLAVPSRNGAFNIKILDPACGSGSFLTYTGEEKQTIKASPAKTLS